MARKSKLLPGKVGYVGESDLYSDSRWVPCVKLSFGESPRDVPGKAIAVWRNPNGAIELKLEPGIKLPQGPRLNPHEFVALTLIDSVGIKLYMTPKGHR